MIGIRDQDVDGPVEEFIDQVGTFRFVDDRTTGVKRVSFKVHDIGHFSFVVFEDHQTRMALYLPGDAFIKMVFGDHFFFRFEGRLDVYSGVDGTEAGPFTDHDIDPAVFQERSFTDDVVPVFSIDKNISGEM